MARRRLFDVPGDESRPAAGTPDLRVVVEPQFQGTPGQPDRPHAADEPGDGRGGGDRRRGGGRATGSAAARCTRDDALSLIDADHGPRLPLRGHDIDTDRIIPARFLRASASKGSNATSSKTTAQPGARHHAFDNPPYQGASVLLVNGNFGCGSSREHAPQALQRWGIRAVVGESVPEIFFGNAVVLGMPCLTVSPEDAERCCRGRGGSDD